jgi:phosphatidylserine decarboxylase
MVRDGYKFAAPPLLAGLAALAFGLKSMPALWIGAVLVLLGAFVVYFFRDPERIIPLDGAAIVSPADGRVMEVAEESFEQRPGRRISIFLAIWNVHMPHRAPRVPSRPVLCRDAFPRFGGKRAERDSPFHRAR